VTPAPPPLGWQTALRLGRVSNLPTVWTNVLAATALAGGVPTPLATLALIVSMSLFYVGGMYLNDAFDREIDARERPERPIPSGAVSARTVFTTGFALLGAGLAIPAGFAFALGDLRPLLGGVLLGGAILYYDWAHKGSWLSPAVMGLCRALVYVTCAAATAAELPAAVWWAAALLLAYIVGLSCAAAQENLKQIRSAWPLVLLAAPLLYLAPRALAPGAPPLALPCLLVFAAWAVAAVQRLARSAPDLRGGVSMLIAGISLFDAVFAALAGAPALALLCLAAAPLTRRLQRSVPGT
jgi:4-hydroxybenzoate polyprenyltransferase